VFTGYQVDLDGQLLWLREGFFCFAKMGCIQPTIIRLAVIRTAIVRTAISIISSSGGHLMGKSILNIYLTHFDLAYLT